MAHDQKYIDLEAYLDGELAPEQAEAFAAALADDPELQAAHDARLADRRLFQEALGEDVAIADLASTVPAAPIPFSGSARAKRLPYSRIGMALAASICLVILVPRVLRNDDGAEGPRSPITRSGQVAVVRYGEIPGETTVLETGYITLPAGLSR